MSDAALRRLETRAPDSAAHLQARLRAGELAQAHVKLAASLGHAGALKLEPDTDQVEWGDWNCRRRTIAAAAALQDATLPKRVAEDWAMHALPHYCASARADADASGPADASVPSEIAAAFTNYPAAAAATAAFYSSEAETAKVAETKRDWQRLRLAAYVLRKTE